MTSPSKGYHLYETEGVPIKSWVSFDELDPGAVKQIKYCARHPHAFHHVALMADAHQGYGMPIGGVVALDGAISPSMVGVDIGCGMSCVRTTLRTESPFWQEKREWFANELMRVTSSLVPVGEGQYQKAHHNWDGWQEYSDTVGDPPTWWSPKLWLRAKDSLGTLGGGNHFIELQEGDDGHVYLMIHSGSRCLGYTIGRHYMEVAKTGWVDARMPFHY